MSPEFSQFIRINNLQPCFDFFQHSDITEDSVLLDGKKVEWAVAKAEIFGEKSAKELPHGWKYNEKGLVKKDLVKWEKLESDWTNKVDPKPGHFFVELVSKKSGFIGVSRHCWIRLIDQDSDVISVGFCGKVLKWKPLRNQKGKFASPDPGEFAQGEKITTRIEITPEEYEKLKAKVEQDQADKNLYFNMVTRNCSVYACGLLKEIDIHIENAEFPSQAVARRFFRWVGFEQPPACVRIALKYIAMVFRFLLSPLYNLGIFVLGGTSTNKDMADLEEQHGAKWPKHRKPFQSFCSLFDGSNFQFGTGWRVTDWQRAVEKLREGANEDEKYARPDPESLQEHNLGYAPVMA